MPASKKLPKRPQIDEALHFEAHPLKSIEELVALQKNPLFGKETKFTHHGKNFLFVVKDTTTGEVAGILRGALHSRQTGRISAQLFPFILEPRYAHKPAFEFAIKRRLLERAVNQFNGAVDEIVFTPHRSDKLFLNTYHRLFFDQRSGTHYKLKIRPRAGTVRIPPLPLNRTIMQEVKGRMVAIVRPFGRRRVTSGSHGGVFVQPFKAKTRGKH